MAEALWRLSAAAMIAKLKSGEASPLEAVDAALARIEETGPQINACPTVCAARARGAAREMMARPASERGPLAGLPIGVKDLVDVEGVRTTYGSPIYADHVPEASDYLVERLEAAGAIVVAKTNTPEFGAGASTFNEVFGKTRNPWNPAKSVAGSSGGSAAALAAGEVWLATGSDLGGSLRTPASFNSVVGLRPSPGRVARGPGATPYNMLAVEGPMARSVADCAIMLDAMAGRDPRDPISLPAPVRPFAEAAAAAKPPARVAWSPTLGHYPVAAEVRAICAAAARRLEALGAIVEEVDPDLHDAYEIFQTLRAAGFAAAHEHDLANHRDKLKPEIVWNIEKGLALSAAEIGAAERARGDMFRRMARFFETYDLLICPSAIVPPFDVDMRYVEEVEGHRFQTYIDWIGVTFAITCTASPALSLPVGFTEAGLPVGLQMVARGQDEAGLLSAAAALEAALDLAPRTPIDPREPAP